MEEQPVVNSQIQQPQVNPVTAKPNYWIIAIIVIISLFILGGVYTLSQRSQKQISSPPKSLTSPPPISPTSTSLTMPTTDPLITANWKTYNNSQFGYEVRHPKEWKVIEDKPKTGTASAQTASSFDDELQRVMFVDTNTRVENWRGEFLISILANPQRLTLDQWSDNYINYKIADVEQANNARLTGKTTLDGIVAKIFSIFSFDRQGEAIVSLHREYIYYILFDSNNPNDQNFEKHKEIYSQILSTFKFTNQNEKVVCTKEAKLCLDGKTYVGRRGPSCEFAPCPQK